MHDPSRSKTLTKNLYSRKTKILFKSEKMYITSWGAGVVQVPAPADRA